MSPTAAIRCLVVACLLLPATLSGCRAPAAPEVPAEIRQAVARELIAAGIDADALERSPGLFRTVDLTSQAAPDWLVDFSAVPNGRLCGTGGCPLQVWVKIGQAPYALAFDHQALGHEVARHDNGRRWLAVELNGVLCGGTGSDPCRYHFEWRGHADAQDGYFAAASIWGKPARYQGPLVQALPARAPAGSAVANVLEGYRAACAAAGGTAELDDALVTLPDLNRDDRPELLFDAGRAYCQRDDQPVAMHCADAICRSQLFTERGGQAWRAAWSGEPFAYGVDFSQPEPRLLVRPADCVGACPERALAWRDGERRFAPVPPEPSRK